MCPASIPDTSTTALPVTGTVFKVDDMTCSHCAGTIRNALRDGMPGVQIDIDMEQQRVTVAGNAEQAAAILRDAGFEAVPIAH